MATDTKNDATQASGDAGLPERLETRDSKEERRVAELVSKPPSTGVMNILKQLVPVISQFAVFLSQMMPFLIAAWFKGKAIYLAMPTNVLKMCYGLGLCFFGGYFVASVAAIEAFRNSGGDAMAHHLQELGIDFKLMLEANAEDDDKDEDNDGIKDVKQINNAELVQRKTLLFLRTVDPHRVSNAVAGLASGTFAMLLTLKVEFSRTVALGLSIGNMLRKPAAAVLAPALGAIVPEAYQKWIEPVLNYACKSIAVTIAWTIQQIISTVQSAIKGGLIFSRAGLRLAKEKGYFDINPDESFVDEMIGWGLAIFGAYFQLASGLRLPFPLSLVMLPLTILEWILRYAVTWM